MLTKMALFGKKKKIDEKPVEASENKQSNTVTDELKVILEAREEEQQEREARALVRQQEQEEAGKEITKLEEQARDAAKKVLEDPYRPEGMTFFMICDEIPMTAEPETPGNIIVRGDLRGTVKAGTEVFIYQGWGERYKVKIEKIRNDNREFVEEASFDRVEIEITRGDLPEAVNPDDDVENPVKRFAVLTDGKGIEDMKDRACRGMSKAGNPRLTAMLVEYGRYGKEPVYFSATMDAIMTTEFITPVKVSAAGAGKNTLSFASVTSKNKQDTAFLPVFTDVKLMERAQKNGFSEGLKQGFALTFPQTAAIARDAHHQGFLINPGGPVTITIPTKLINDMVTTRLFLERYGEGAADDPGKALGGAANIKPESIRVSGGDLKAAQRVVIRNPNNTPEFLAIEKAVKSYCGSHSDIAKLIILVLHPENNPKDQSYLCIVDCPDSAFAREYKGLTAAMKPFMKSIRKIQFQQFDKMPDKETFAKRSKWLYSKLPI